MKRHILVGTSSAILLVAVYLGLISLDQGFTHALQRAGELWFWVLALAAGFGAQVALFSFIRQSTRQRQLAGGSAVGASGVISTGSMAACCAHHLSDVLPLLGLSGLSIFLARYQLFFIVLGILSNLVGITMMLETIQNHGLSRRVAAWKWNMHRLKRMTMVSAVVISVTFLVVLLILQ